VCNSIPKYGLTYSSSLDAEGTRLGAIDTYTSLAAAELQLLYMRANAGPVYSEDFKACRLDSPSPWGGFTESLLSAIPNAILYPHTVLSHGPTWGRESLQIAHLFPIVRHVIIRSCNKRGGSYEFYTSISISLLRILLCCDHVLSNEISVSSTHDLA
jgi:hypothetical protein